MDRHLRETSRGAARSAHGVVAPRLALTLALAGLCAASPGPALAQGLDRDIDITATRTPPGPDPLIGAEGTALTAPGRLTFGATLRWTDHPLVVVDESGDERLALVEGRLGLDFGLAVGVTRWLELAASFPTVLYQFGESQGDGIDLPALASGGTGDLRVRAKAAVLSSAEDGFGLAFVLEGAFPTGLTGGFLSDGAPGLEALVIGDFRLLGWHLSLAVGYRVRPERELGDLNVDDEFLWRVGFRAALPRGFGILIDATGAHGLLGPDGAFGAQDEGPILLHLGVDFPGRGDLRAVVGGGMGVTSGFGAPRFDVFASIRYAPRDHDSDSDTILDHADRCLEIPEDLDGFEDEDGCPDEDNDQDGVPDLIDGCPITPEDLDGFEDEDGCPDEDNDQDGIIDASDRCPDQAEDRDQVQDDDGCPEPDTDGDGVDDPIDACPDRLEDADGFEDHDGCPDEDNDQDGRPDESDQSPNEPEDLDGFQDEDGVPDLDNDGDGVNDPVDRCPDEAEDDDDFEDDDGCPERGGRIRGVVRRRPR